MWDEHTLGSTVQQRFDIDYARPAADSFWAVRPGDPGAVDLFHNAVYHRGAMTLQALRMAVGSRAFLSILRTWADQHRHGNASTHRFIELAERLSGRQLDHLFQQWLYTPGKPSLLFTTF